MPSVAQAGSDDGDLPEWRQNLKDQIGEDPARWLDRDLYEHTGTRTKTVERGHRTEVQIVPDQDTSTHGEEVQALIRGIDRLERLEAWRAAERRLGWSPDGGPRSVVIDLLDERRAELEEIGERPERLPCGPWVSYEEWQAASEDVDLDEIRASRRSTATASSSSTTSADASSTDTSRASSLDQFATDGGREEGDDA